LAIIGFEIGVAEDAAPGQALVLMCVVVTALSILHRVADTWSNERAREAGDVEATCTTEAGSGQRLPSATGSCEIARSSPCITGLFPVGVIHRYVSRPPRVDRSLIPMASSALLLRLTAVEELPIMGLPGPRPSLDSLLSSRRRGLSISGVVVNRPVWT